MTYGNDDQDIRQTWDSTTAFFSNLNARLGERGAAAIDAQDLIDTMDQAAGISLGLGLNADGVPELTGSVALHPVVGTAIEEIVAAIGEQGWTTLTGASAQIALGEAWQRTENGFLGLLRQGQEYAAQQAEAASLPESQGQQWQEYTAQQAEAASPPESQGQYDSHGGQVHFAPHASVFDETGRPADVPVTDYAPGTSTFTYSKAPGKGGDVAAELLAGIVGGLRDTLNQTRAKLEKPYQRAKKSSSNPNKSQGPLKTYRNVVAASFPSLADRAQSCNGLEDLHGMVQRRLVEMDATLNKLASDLRVDGGRQASEPLVRQQVDDRLRRMSRTVAEDLENLRQLGVTGGLPTMAGALYSAGQAYATLSSGRQREGSGAQIHRVLERILKGVPSELRSKGHGSCSEMTVLSQYIDAWVHENEDRYRQRGVDLDDLDVLERQLLKHFDRAGTTTVAHFMNGKGGVYGVPACQSCRTVLAKLGIQWQSHTDILTPEELKNVVPRAGQSQKEAVEEAERAKMQQNLETLRWYRGPDRIEGGPTP